MCYHNSIHANKQHLERKYKKKLNEQKQIFSPIFHSSGFEFGYWPVVTAQSEYIEFFNWGLVPYWTQASQDLNALRPLTLNARIETITEKPSFKNGKRCLVSSTGFFEWQTEGKQKIPYYISLKSDEIFSMAGIYDVWINNTGEKMYSFSIVTTEANPLMANIHNLKKRMPLILHEHQENDWLNERVPYESFTKPFDELLMKAHTVGNTILSKNHNTAKVIEPQLVQIQKQLDLF